jgi:hypothetical protein
MKVGIMPPTGTVSPNRDIDVEEVLWPTIPRVSALAGAVSQLTPGKSR